MKSKMFRDLKNQSIRAKLFSLILDETEELLSHKEIEDIVNSDAISLYKHYQIILVRSAHHFSNLITLIDDVTTYSFHDRSEGHKDKCTVITGDDLEFGKNKTYKYFNDNNIIEVEEKSKKMPNFNIYSSYVILRESNVWRNFNMDGIHGYDEFYNQIIIYVPNKKPFTLDERIKYILDNFIIKIEGDV